MIEAEGKIPMTSRAASVPYASSQHRHACKRDGVRLDILLNRMVAGMFSRFFSDKFRNNRKHWQIGRVPSSAFRPGFE